MAKYVPVNIAHKVFNHTNRTDESLSPVIFLHGLAGSTENWDDIPQVVADETKRKVYALDARNHGDSGHSDDFNFDLNVDDLFHFMDNMNIPKAALVGQSMGGLTASNAALRKPERIEMIVSEDMHITKMPQPIIDTILSFFKLFMEILPNIPSNLNESEATKFAVDTFISKISPDTPFFDESKAEMDKTTFSFKRTPAGGYDAKFNKEAIFRALSNAETLVSDPCGQFSGPAYFLYGELSPMQVGKGEDIIRKHFPNAELIEFEGANHNVHGEFPDKFKKTVLQCLKLRR